MGASPFTGKKNRLIFAACFLLWTFFQFLRMKEWTGRWDLALIDSIVSNGLLAMVCVLIANTLGYYRPRQGRYIVLVIWCLAFCGIWSAIVRFGLGLLLEDGSPYEVFLEKSMPIRFDLAALITGVVALFSMLWYNLEEQKESEGRKVDADRLAREAELFKLRQQLQPHFLFNSLNSISALAGSRPEEARKMIQQLSDFLRGTLKKDEAEWVSLQEEIEHLSLYLEIEKVRFGHRLSTEITYDEAASKTALPPMILQPVVENAIKFGLYDTTDDVCIRISARRSGNQLLIEVTNPYDPQTAAPREGTGFGLNSIRRRLYLLFARSDLLETSVMDNRFTTTIKIPVNDQSNTDR